MYSELGLRIGELDWELEFGIRDWEWGLGFEIGMDIGIEVGMRLKFICD